MNASVQREEPTSRGAVALAERIVSRLEADGPLEARVNHALAAIAELLAEDEASAEALFVGMRGGVEARQCRQAFVQRICGALDAACRDDQGGPLPPPLTARFLVGAVEGAVCKALVGGRPREFSEAIPDLALLIRRTYSR